MKTYPKKQSTPFDRAKLKVQLMNFSKALMSVMWSYHAMRKSAPFLAFLCNWHYLTNLWQMSPSPHSTGGGSCQKYHYATKRCTVTFCNIIVFLSIAHNYLTGAITELYWSMQLFKPKKSANTHEEASAPWSATKYRCCWNRWNLSMCTLGTRMHILVLPKLYLFLSCLFLSFFVFFL